MWNSLSLRAYRVIYNWLYFLAISHDCELSITCAFLSSLLCTVNYLHISHSLFSHMKLHCYSFRKAQSLYLHMMLRSWLLVLCFHWDDVTLPIWWWLLQFTLKGFLYSHMTLYPQNTLNISIFSHDSGLTIMVSPADFKVHTLVFLHDVALIACVFYSLCTQPADFRVFVLMDYLFSILVLSAAGAQSPDWFINFESTR